MRCIFCNIVSGRAPSTIHYEDNDIIIISNKLQWVPIMLLAMPKKHLTQTQLWQDTIMSRIGQAVVQIGNLVAPDGFRLLSNFGENALQTQEHGHIHLIGGSYLGRYA